MLIQLERTNRIRISNAHNNYNRIKYYNVICPISCQRTFGTESDSIWHHFQNNGSSPTAGNIELALATFYIQVKNRK